MTPTHEADALRLCYVEEPWAYFSDNPNQWGDDWDDAPYECNAGEPYEVEGFHILKVAYTCKYESPHYWFQNDPLPLSVEDINKKKFPWFYSPRYGPPMPPIYAGATLQEFVTAIKASGGQVWVPME